MFKKVIFLSIFSALFCSYYSAKFLLNSVTSSAEIKVSTSLKKAPEAASKGYIRVVLNNKVKRNIFKEKQERLSRKLKLMSESQAMIVDQRLSFNKELRKEISDRSQFIPVKNITKVVTPKKIIKQRKTVAKIRKVIPKLSFENEYSEYSIRSGINFSHTGYTVAAIEKLNLTKLVAQVTSKPYSKEVRVAVNTQKNGPIEPLQSEKKIIAKPVPEIKLAKNISDKDKLVYRFSANRKEAVAERKMLKKAPVSVVKVKNKPETVKLLSEKSSTAKSLTPSPLSPQMNVVKDEKDELVFFDYSKEEKPSGSIGPKTDHGAKAPLIASAGVNTQKNKKMEFITFKRPSAKVNTQNPLPNNTNKNMSFLKDLNSPKNDSKDKNDNAGTGDQISASSFSESSIIVNGYQFPLNEKEDKEPLDYFQVVLEDTDEDEVTNSGKIVFSEKLSSDYASRRARLISKEFITTIFNLNYIKDSEDWNLEVPTFSRDSYYDLLQSEKVSEDSASLLVKLSSETKKVKVSDKNTKKIYFNGSYDVVSSLKDAVYVLFINVNPGNNYITYETNDDEVAFSEVHLKSDELYFESNIFQRSSKYLLNLERKSIMGSTTHPMDILSKNVSKIYEEISAVKVGINTYLFEDEIYQEGMRRSFRVYDGEELNIGTWGKSKVVIPGKKFRTGILDKMDVRDFRNQCLIQVNLEKEVDSVSFKGEAVESENKKYFSISRPMNIEMMVQDKNGQFYEDAGKDTKTLYLKGYGRGILNLSVQYSDGSNDYFQSYCDSNYLIEQL